MTFWNHVGSLCPSLYPSRHSLPFCRVAGSLNVGPEDTHGHCVLLSQHLSNKDALGLLHPGPSLIHLVFVWKGWERAVGKCWEFIGSCGIMATGLTSSILLSLSTTEPKSFIYRSRFTPVVIKQYAPCFTGKKWTIQTQNKRECRWGVGERNLPEVTRLE